MEIEIKTQINTEVLSREVVIQTEDEYSQAGDVLKLCKNKIKELEEERKSYTKPLDESKKRIMAKFNETIEPIEAYIGKLNKAMSNWFVAEEKKRQEEQKRLEAEAIAKADDNEPDIIVPIVESAKTIRGNVATTIMVKSWDFEIINGEEVERIYCSPDEKKIREAVKNGAREIKGVKIFEKFTPKSK